MIANALLRRLIQRTAARCGGWTRLWFIWLSICARPARLKLRAPFGAVFYVVCMIAQTLGFGTDAAGVRSFSHSGAPLGDLARSYVGSAMADILGVRGGNPRGGEKPPAGICARPGSQCVRRELGDGPFQQNRPMR